MTPLQIGLAWSAIGIDGRLPAAQLVTGAQDEEGLWQPVEEGRGFTGTAFSPNAASMIRSALPRDSGLLGYSTLVLSGPEGNRHAWFLGLAPEDAPRFLVVVVVEQSESTNEAESIGHQVLEAARSE